MNGRGPSKRGVGLGFGPDVTKRWCEKEGVTGMTICQRPAYLQWATNVLIAPFGCSQL